MKTEILKLLRESSGYLSGQELCDSLGVSRTAVWKVMKQLREEGYQIEAVSNRGYRLVSAADVITEAELKSQIEGGLAGSHLEYHEELDSTNNRAKRLGEEGAPEGTLVTADYQTAGKGRRGRGWVSERGTGIWMSLLLRPDIPPSGASMLTLVAAMAVVKGIKEATGLDSGIKWPNDIVMNGKKICGILTEMSTELDHISYVVIGMGINANIREFPEDIREKATSLYLESGQTVVRSRVIAAVMKHMDRYYQMFLECGDLSGLLEEYEEHLVNRGREVMVLSPVGEYRGVSLGIDKTGELLVQLKDGTVNHVVSGEVSVRGIYGYV
ncbi:MAG: biotin--[acetyl-CoA-carboxylase] ligase [Hungatella hathewayi]|nr:biotin--[acetyl-CoA-carboxylase] ligase [Hungatella hathewayi]